MSRRLDEFLTMGPTPAEVAALYDRAVAAASEWGTEVCPRCFSANTVLSGFRERVWGRVQRCLCRSCLRYFVKGWVPVRTNMPPEQLEIALTLMSAGMSMNATSEALKLLSNRISWVVPLTSSALLYMTREATELLERFERALIEASGRVECRILALISSTRRIDGGGKRIAISAAALPSGYWFETEVLPALSDDLREFALTLKSLIKGSPRKVVVVGAASTAAEDLKMAFPSSSIAEVKILSREIRGVSVSISRRISPALLRGTLEIIPFIRARYNFLEGRARAAGLPMPKSVKSWTDLFRYAIFFLQRVRT